LPLEDEQSVPPPQTGGTLGVSIGKPVRYLGRRIGGQSQTSPFDTGSPASPFVPSQNQNSPMGLPGLIAATLARSDPPEPNQLVPSPPYDAPRGFTNNDPEQPWFFQGWR
jgi:hypothetical protein